MAGQQIGYIRVSSYAQKTDRQLVDIALDKIFEEKASAKTAERPELKRCIEHCREGDSLHIHSIDRLARNLSDLQNIVDGLTSKGVAVHFHKENLTFSSAGGDENPMNRLMLQMLGGFAEFERSIINERRKEGMAQAKAKGKQVGRKPSLSGDDIKEIRKRHEAGETISALAKTFAVSRQTIYASLSRKESQDAKA